MRQMMRLAGWLTGGWMVCVQRMKVLVLLLLGFMWLCYQWHYGSLPCIPSCGKKGARREKLYMLILIKLFKSINIYLISNFRFMDGFLSSLHFSMFHFRALPHTQRTLFLAHRFCFRSFFLALLLLLHARGFSVVFIFVHLALAYVYCLWAVRECDVSCVADSHSAERQCTGVCESTKRKAISSKTAYAARHCCHRCCCCCCCVLYFSSVYVLSPDICANSNVYQVFFSAISQACSYVLLAQKRRKKNEKKQRT